MRNRLAKDFTRNNVATIPALVLSLVFLALMTAHYTERAEFSDRATTFADFGIEVLVPFYLVLWSGYCFAAAALTHWVYSGIPECELAERSLHGNQGFSPLQRLAGATGAASLAVQAAAVSAVMALMIAQSDAYDGNRLIAVLALLSVVGSWLSMVYFYSLHYLRLWAKGESVDLAIGEHEQPRFADFLHFTVATTTLLGGGMHWKSRRGRQAVTVNSILALLFNTIVVAITVSLVVI